MQLACFHLRRDGSSPDETHTPPLSRTDTRAQTGPRIPGVASPSQTPATPHRGARVIHRIGGSSSHATPAPPRWRRSEDVRLRKKSLGELSQRLAMLGEHEPRRVLCLGIKPTNPALLQ